MKYLSEQVGNTRLCALRTLGENENKNRLYVKLEGDNPAGSVKDRAALNMIQGAEKRGDIKPGDTLIEATSGNTGIALAMVAATKGYNMTLVMPEHASEERKKTMAAYGATLISVPTEQGMLGARDLATKMEQEGKGKCLNQFANPDNPAAHYATTGPELWQATNGKITHFVSAMGTTGTIMGVSRFLKEKNPEIQIVGVQPKEGARIPGIRRWPEEYLPKFFESFRVDKIFDVSQEEAEQHSLKLAKKEGIFCGISSGGALAAARRLSDEVKSAFIVSIVCDRGDRYLSTPAFNL